MNENWLEEILSRQGAWESRFNPNAKNPHSTARGIGQFLKGTWDEFKREMKNPNLDPHNPYAAIQAQRWYMNKIISDPKFKKYNLTKEQLLPIAVGAYYKGAGGIRTEVDEALKKGADIKDPQSLLSYLPKDTSTYISGILFKSNPKFEKEYEQLKVTSPIAKLYGDQGKFSTALNLPKLPEPFNYNVSKKVEIPVASLPKEKIKSKITPEVKQEIVYKSEPLSNKYNQYLNQGEFKVQQPIIEPIRITQENQTPNIVQKVNSIIGSNLSFIPKFISSNYSYKSGGSIKKYQAGNKISSILQYNPLIGIPLNGAKKFMSNIADNIRPYGYDHMVKRVITSGLLNKKDPYRNYDKDKLESSEIERTDLLQLLSNKPQKYNSILPSKYSPTIGRDKNKQYFKSDLTESNLKESLKSIPIKSKNDFNEILGKQGYNSPSLGDATLGYSKDKEGSYISYYDKWDLNPIPKSGIKWLDKTVDNIVTGIPNILGVTNTPEVYGRIYLDPITGKPK